VRKVLVVGAGGIGGYVAAVLSAGGANITLLARGQNLAAIRENGLRIEGGPDQVLTWPTATSELGAQDRFDLVLLATKNYDTDIAVKEFLPALAADGQVLVLQNGLDRASYVSSLIGRDAALEGVVYLEARLEAPGVVWYFSGPRRFEIGDTSSKGGERSEAVAEELRGFGLNAVASPDARTAAWRKVVLVATANSLTAATRMPFGSILEQESGLVTAERLLQEAVLVARADGADLAMTYAADAMKLLRELGPTLRSSMLHDVERGRPTEVDFLNGEIVRRGRSHGIPAPLHELMWLILGDAASQVGRS
jgi:2-dehydropantoate 2-reductase